MGSGRGVQLRLQEGWCPKALANVCSDGLKPTGYKTGPQRTPKGNPGVRGLKIDAPLQNRASLHFSHLFLSFPLLSSPLLRPQAWGGKGGLPPLPLLPFIFLIRSSPFLSCLATPGLGRQRGFASPSPPSLHFSHLFLSFPLRSCDPRLGGAKGGLPPPPLVPIMHLWRALISLMLFILFPIAPM